jgi:hypothetical protein
VRHRANPRFWVCYRQLSDEIRRSADESYRLLRRDPKHPSLLQEDWALLVGEGRLALQGARCGRRRPDGVVLDRDLRRIQPASQRQNGVENAEAVYESPTIRPKVAITGPPSRFRLAFMLPILVVLL